MGGSENRGTPKSSHFSKVFHYKPSILGYPYFWKHPYSDSTFKNKKSGGTKLWGLRGLALLSERYVMSCMSCLSWVEAVKDVHPWNLTWNLKRSPWKRRFLLETIIFRFHVKFQGCIIFFQLWGIIGEKNTKETCFLHVFSIKRSILEVKLHLKVTLILGNGGPKSPVVNRGE